MNEEVERVWITRPSSSSLSSSSSLVCPGAAPAVGLIDAYEVVSFLAVKRLAFMQLFSPLIFSLFCFPPF